MIRRDEHYGGAVVRRPFTAGDRKWLAGETLNAREISKIPAANRAAMIERGYLTVWPAQHIPREEGTKRYLVQAGPGMFHVVEGKIIAASLPRDAAVDMRDAAETPAAGIPLTPDAPSDQPN